MKPLRKQKAIAPTKKAKVKKTHDEMILEMPPKPCLSCKQNSHEFDKHALPKKIRLKWVEFDKSRVTGKKTCSGDECYTCFDVRRRFFDATFKTLQ